MHHTGIFSHTTASLYLFSSLPLSRSVVFLDGKDLTAELQFAKMAALRAFAFLQENVSVRGVGKVLPATDVSLEKDALKAIVKTD